MMPRLNRLVLTRQRPAPRLKTMNNQLAQNIKRSRKAVKKTQAEVANFVGIDRTALVKIERGDRDIKAAELEKIAAFLGVSVAALMTAKPEVRDRFDYNTLPFSC